MNQLWKILPVSLALLATYMITGCSGKGSGPGVLVDTNWLQNNLKEPDIVLLHSGTAEVYDSIHIPGARLITPASFSINTENLHNEIPADDSIVSLLRCVGVNDHSRVVLYYENSRFLSRTAKVFVTLDYIGLGSRTFVLNGGLPEWQEEGGETTDQPAKFKPGNLESTESGTVVITASELDRQRWNQDIVVIDTRTDREYFGTPANRDHPAEGGHIEGARSLPYQVLLSDDKPYLFRTDRELKDKFRRTGMEPDKVSVFYCGSGGRASVCYMLAKHLHYSVLLYDGSYEEWVAQKLPLTGPVPIPDELNKEKAYEE
jgi:thiosulfate/3-mercaptopyruvate sulfurtransferase